MALLYACGNVMSLIFVARQPTTLSTASDGRRIDALLSATERSGRNSYLREVSDCIGAGAAPLLVFLPRDAL